MFLTSFHRLVLILWFINWYATAVQTPETLIEEGSEHWECTGPLSIHLLADHMWELSQGRPGVKGNDPKPCVARPWDLETDWPGTRALLMRLTDREAGAAHSWALGSWVVLIHLIDTFDDFVLAQSCKFYSPTNHSYIGWVILDDRRSQKKSGSKRDGVESEKSENSDGLPSQEDESEWSVDAEQITSQKKSMF